MGGAAVFFELIRRGLKPLEAPVRLSDVNEELINLYRVLQGPLEVLLERLECHAERHCEEYFYQVRGWDVAPLDEVERAARLIYLNKTCFNGLYRVNSKGLFNVPFGRYKNPGIVQPRRLQAAHQALQGVELAVEPFHQVLRWAQEGDLVYFDPPYQPLSATSSFTSYARSSFGEAEQAQLAEVFRELDRRGVWVLLSNSETPLVRQLYEEFDIHVISAARFINSKAQLRSAIAEVLVVGSRYKAASRSPKKSRGNRSER